MSAESLGPIRDDEKRQKFVLLSSMLRVPPENENEIHDLYDYLKQQRIKTEVPLLEKYINSQENIARRDSRERVQALLQIADGLWNYEVHALSYGAYLPFYIQAMREQVPHEDTTNYKALLIGALSSETVDEFQAAVTRTIPHSTVMICDKETWSVGTHANEEGIPYMVANGVHLPVASNSIDSIHTNYLLGDLTPPETDAFFDEIFRVLKPGGMAIMAEEEAFQFKTKWTDKNDRDVFSDKLTQRGFTAKISSVSQVSTRRIIWRYMSGEIKTFTPEMVETAHHTIGIKAYKPRS